MYAGSTVDTKLPCRTLVIVQRGPSLRRTKASRRLEIRSKVVTVEFQSGKEVRRANVSKYPHLVTSFLQSCLK
jgi:hypothetical protein